MCVCVLLLLFPPPPPRSLELFTHVFAVGFTVSANRLGVTISAGFCWSTQCFSIESYSDVKIVPTVFSHPILAKKTCVFHHALLIFHACSIILPSFSIDFPLMFHDFAMISPVFPLHFPYFQLIFHDFTCIFHIFHWFSMISPSFPLHFPYFPWLFGLWFLVHVGQGQGGVRLRGLQPRPGLRPTGPGGHGALLPMDGSPGALGGPGWLGKIGRLSRDIYG